MGNNTDSKGAPKLLHGINRTGLTWKDQNPGRKVEVIYMDEPCNTDEPCNAC